MPRRPRRKPTARAVAIEPETNFIARVLLHSPKDTLAGAVAAAAALAIMFNALFLQAGRHPSPMFGTGTVADQAAVVTPMPQPIPRARPMEADVKPAEIKPAEQKAPVAAAKIAAPPAANVARPPAAIPSRSDPVGDLIISSRRIASVQRSLTEYGYGQLKPTGVVGADTQAAIRKFESDRKKPQTGQMSDWLMTEIVKLTGRPID